MDIIAQIVLIQILILCVGDAQKNVFICLVMIVYGASGASGCTAGLGAVSWGLGLDAGEEAQVERAGDLDGFQSEGGRIEREGDRVYHLRVHQQLRALTTVS